MNVTSLAPVARTTAGTGLVAILIMLFAMARPAAAVELLSTADAVKRVFLTSDSIAENAHTLSPQVLAELKKKLGGKLFAGRKAEGVTDNSYTLYVGRKAGTVTGVAVVLEEFDEWGPLGFIIVVDPASGTVSNIVMMKYVDARVRSLSSRAFLKSFFGKGLDDDIKVGKDINAVSGATVSAGILCFMVKKAVALVMMLEPAK